MSIKARPAPACKPAFFGTFSTHHKGTVAHAWDVLLGKRPLPLTQRCYEKAVRLCVDFLWETRILGERDRPSFRYYLEHVAKRTDDPEGDFVSDARRDPRFPIENTWQAVERHVRRDPVVVKAAQGLWWDYEVWRQNYEHLSQPISFSNQQWAVTSFGVESVDNVRYHFEMRRVAEMRGGTDLLDWPLHMAEKDWVDMALFEEAFRFALKKWAPEVSLGIINRSFARAHGERS